MKTDNWFIKLVKFIAGIFQGKANESIKRVIAFLFSLALIDIAIYTKLEAIQKFTISGMIILIALLLGLATAEAIINIFKNGNKPE